MRPEGPFFDAHGNDDIEVSEFYKKNPKQFLFWRPESPLCAWRPPRNTDEQLLGRISGNLSTGSSFVEYISKIQAKYVFKNIYILALRSDNSKFH